MSLSCSLVPRLSPVLCVLRVQSQCVNVRLRGGEPGDVATYHVQSVILIHSAANLLKAYIWSSSKALCVAVYCKVYLTEHFTYWHILARDL